MNGKLPKGFASLCITAGVSEPESGVEISSLIFLAALLV